MNHLDEGQIQAFLDDEPTGQQRAAMAQHLMVCGTCRSLHDELRRAKGLIATSFQLLDGPAPPAERRSVERPRRTARIHTALIRAAGLVLFLAAAAAAAVPGSPLRAWIVQVADRTELTDRAAPEPTPVAIPQRTSEATAAAVAGTVRGSRGQPLAFAQVSVVGDTVSAWTDEAGAYHLEGAARDRLRVRATHPGHEPVERSVRLPASGQVPLDFSLQPRPGPTQDPLADFRPFDIAYTLPTLLNAAEVTAAIEARYPPDLADRLVGGEAVLRLWLDENGRVARSALSRSSGQPRLDAIALTISREMRFRPATSRDEAVRVIVQIPVVFVPEDHDGS